MARTKPHPNHLSHHSINPSPGSNRRFVRGPNTKRPNTGAPDKLEDCAAIITGGDSGIGRAVAVLFAREGADVAIVYLPVEESDAQTTRQGGGGRRPARAADSRRRATVGILRGSRRAHGRGVRQARYRRQQRRLSTASGVDRGHHGRTARSHVSHQHLRLLLHDPRRAAAPESRARPSSTPARSPASRAASSCSTTAPPKARFTRSRNRLRRTSSRRRFA